MFRHRKNLLDTNSFLFDFGRCLLSIHWGKGTFKEKTINENQQIKVKTKHHEYKACHILY